MSSLSPFRLAWGLRESVAALVLMFVRQLPGQPGVLLRRLYWSRRLGALGAGVRIDEGVHIVNPESVFIGSGCWIAANAFIGAGAPSIEGREIVRRDNPRFEGGEGEVHIGDHAYMAPASLINGHGGVDIGANASLGAGAKLYSTSHHHRGPGSEEGAPPAAAGMRRSPSDLVSRQALLVGAVVIGPEAFVGSNAIVLPGVTLGAASWLGAGAVTRRDLEPAKVYRAPEPTEVKPAAGSTLTSR